MNSKHIRVFSKPIVEYYILRYIDLVCSILMIVLYTSVLSGIAEANNLDRWITAIPYILVLFISLSVLIRKMAYKISINTETGEVLFYMYKGKDPTKVHIRNISKIRFGIAIVFTVSDKKIIFPGVTHKPLLDLLSSITSTKWTLLGKLNHKYNIDEVYEE